MGFLYEIQHIRHLEMKAWRYWEGIRSFVTTVGNAGSTAADLYDNEFPSSGLGASNPVCRRAKVIYKPLGVRGTAMILAYYKTPMVPGRTIVRERIISQARRATHSIPTTTRVKGLNGRLNKIIPVDAEVCEGPDGTPMFEWRIVEGTNIQLESISEIEVETAISAANYNLESLWSIKDEINSDSFNIRGQVPPGTLLFKGFSSEDRYHIDPIPVTYKFWYNPWGWNTQCYKQGGIWVITKMPSYTFQNESQFTRVENEERTVKNYIPGAVYQETTSGNNEVVIDEESQAWKPVPLFYSSNFGAVIPDTGSW